MKNIILMTLLGATLHSNAQELIATSNAHSFPQGMYATLDDIILAKPTNGTNAFTMKMGSDSIAYRFYDAASGDRLKKAFAFSNDGFLYLRMKDILKNMAKEDQGQLKDDGDYHVRALDIGPKYIYFEDYFTSSAAALWGGAIATAASRKLKGLVYDQESRQFNLFRNTKDFEAYIALNHPEYIDLVSNTTAADTGKNGKKHHADINLVSKVIFEINAKGRSVN